MIYHVHEKKDKITGVTKPDGRGKKTKSKIADNQMEIVVQHINSFPFIPSHYCRAKTNKKYVQFKLSYYRYIFNTKLNIRFHTPKTDRCEKCEEMKVKMNEKIPISEEGDNLHKNHLAENITMRVEKSKDKSIMDKKTLLVVFDLENNINVPKAEVGSFFCKRKLTAYNLTAMTSSKRGYCALRTEAISGHAGNDIASVSVLF